MNCRLPARIHLPVLLASSFDDPVLLELDSGARVTESMLMPPPLSPKAAATVEKSPTFHQVITIASIPLDKTIRVVEPDLVRWYQHQLKLQTIQESKRKCSGFRIE